MRMFSKCERWLFWRFDGLRSQSLTRAQKNRWGPPKCEQAYELPSCAELSLHFFSMSHWLILLIRNVSRGQKQLIIKQLKRIANCSSVPFCPEAGIFFFTEGAAFWRNTDRKEKELLTIRKSINYLRSEFSRSDNLGTQGTVEVGSERKADIKDTWYWFAEKCLVHDSCLEGENLFFFFCHLLFLLFLPILYCSVPKFKLVLKEGLHRSGNMTHHIAAARMWITGEILGHTLKLWPSRIRPNLSPQRSSLSLKGLTVTGFRWDSVNKKETPGNIWVPTSNTDCLQTKCEFISKGTQRRLTCTFTKSKHMLRQQNEGMEKSKEWKSLRFGFRHRCG